MRQTTRKHQGNMQEVPPSYDLGPVRAGRARKAIVYHTIARPHRGLRVPRSNVATPQPDMLHFDFDDGPSPPCLTTAIPKPLGPITTPPNIPTPASAPTLILWTGPTSLCRSRFIPRWSLCACPPRCAKQASPPSPPSPRASPPRPKHLLIWKRWPSSSTSPLASHEKETIPAANSTFAPPPAPGRSTKSSFIWFAVISPTCRPASITSPPPSSACAGCAREIIAASCSKPPAVNQPSPTPRSPSFAPAPTGATPGNIRPAPTVISAGTTALCWPTCSPSPPPLRSEERRV